MASNEKRISKRVMFSAKDQIKGIVQPSGETGKIATQIINLSQGGMHLITQRDPSLDLKTGDELDLVAIEGISQLASLVTVKARVKWVLDHDYLDHIGIGCEFKNLSANQSDDLNSYIGAVSQ